MRRFLPLSTVLSFFLASAEASETSYTLHRDLDGYDGVEDTMLYAPQSVANINYGKQSSLHAGINRWGEHYVSLIRFDLGQVPRSAEIKQAVLWLYDRSKDYPKRVLSVDVQSITPANRGWVEGTGDGTRVPIEGATCWNRRRFPNEKWAGSSGLRTAGVDYALPPMGSTTVEPGHQGWLKISLDPTVVQEWVNTPATNAGMRLYPLGARHKGDIVVTYSSDAPEPELRPRLLLTIEMDDPTASRFRRTRALHALSSVQDRLDGVRETLVAAGNPARATRVLAHVTAAAAKSRQRINQASLGSDKALAETLVEIEGLEARAEAIPDEIVLGKAETFNRTHGLSTDFALGIADGMMNVLRVPGRFPGHFGPVAHLAMAKNEFEPIQVVIVPVDKDVQAARWSVTPLKGPDGATIPARDIRISVMGYMKAIKPAVRTQIEWWPQPILDFMDSVDVPQGTIQPLWVVVRTRPDTPAGRYEGTLTVRAEGLEAKSVTLRVRVWDFAVPVEQHLLTVWGNNEGTYKKIYGDRFDTNMARAMFDFFLEHRLAVSTLYSPQAAGQPVDDGWFERCIGYPTLSDPNELRRLWEAGSRWWNLGYLHPVFANKSNADMEWDAYVGKFIEMIRSSLKVADAAGWPRENLGIYFFDETREFEKLNRAASRVKEAFPDIPLMTTGYDRSYGVRGGPIDKSIDIWCPLTPRFVRDRFHINEGRRYGKKVWWYVCCAPRGEKDLNFFSQFPAIRSRLLMGLATWKYRPDGFLYYRVSGWRHYDKPIDQGPLTDWKPYFLPGPDGDGELICPGPHGPLSTLHFENIRDGIEDYEYYWVLSDLIAKAMVKGIDVSAEADLLEIPAGLLASLTDYSEDPRKLRAQRRKVAGAIVRLQRKTRR